MSAKVRPTCPNCGRLLAGVAPMRHATTATRQTCRGCRTSWSIVVAPLKVRDGIRVDMATLAEVKS